MDDPHYPPPRFAEPIYAADCIRDRQADGTISTKYWVNRHRVPEEIFAAAVAELGSHWPPRGPAFRSTTGRVCLFLPWIGPIHGTLSHWNNRLPLDKE